jgi:hypothetical protein
MRSDITNVPKDSRQRGPVREAYIFAAVRWFKRIGMEAATYARLGKQL